MTQTRCWLLKTEPVVFSFADLLAAPAQTTVWEGVRNYGARNFMREMRAGDAVLIYHSSTKNLGVVGLAEVARESYPDPTQFDPDSPGFDPKASRDAPRWVAVDVRAQRALPRTVTLQELRAHSALSNIKVVQKGNRLSVMPVACPQLEAILELAGTPHAARV